MGGWRVRGDICNVWKYTGSSEYLQQSWTTGWTPPDITVVVSLNPSHNETHLFVWLLHQVPSLRAETSQELQGQTYYISYSLSPNLHTYTHTQGSIVCLFQCRLLRRLLLPSLTANNKELNVFATEEMDEKEQGTCPQGLLDIFKP